MQSLSRVRLFAMPWTAAHQASLSFTISMSFLKLMSTELVMPSNYLIPCHPLLLLPSIFPSIRVFSNELAIQIRWPKYWSLSFSISPSSKYSGLWEKVKVFFPFLYKSSAAIFAIKTHVHWGSSPSFCAIFRVDQVFHWGPFSAAQNLSALGPTGPHSFSPHHSPSLPFYLVVKKQNGSRDIRQHHWSKPACRLSVSGSSHKSKIGK